jgi:hypothetical protein
MDTNSSQVSYSAFKVIRKKSFLIRAPHKRLEKGGSRSVGGKHNAVKVSHFGKLNAAP